MAKVNRYPTKEADWEAAWSPYDEATYQAALEMISTEDAVLDIGAGDLRFARRVAARSRRVTAIEQRAEFLTGPYPPNLTVLVEETRAGWYACLCGAIGFIAGSAEAINSGALDEVIEVAECPDCRGRDR